MRILRSSHFWLIVVIFFLCGIFHYAEYIGIVGTETPSSHFGLTRHAVERILFLVPIIYAGYIFGRTAGLATCFAALVVMLPRAIFFSPSPADAILESIGIAVIGVLATQWLWTRARESKKTQQALAELQRTHGILQYYIQSARSNEKRLTILNTISTVLGESLELEAVLRKAIRMVSELIEVEVTLIYSLNEESQELVLASYEGVSEEFARALGSIKLDEGLYGEVARTGQAVVVEDASRTPRLTDPEVQKMRIQVQLIVPMICRDRVRGIVCVAMRRPREFTSEDIELLTAVSTQIATAVENARLYEKERLAAQRLAVSERNLRRLFENASDAIWVHDLTGNIITANKATERLTGYTMEEMTRMNVRTLLPDEGLSVAGKIRRKLFEKEPVEQPYEQRLIRKDGTEAILMLSTDLDIEDGKPIAFQHIARDVTKERHAEEVLKESERELSQILEGSSVPILVINKDHILTHWNKACESLTGVSASEVVGTNKQWLAFYTEERPVMADLVVDNVPEEEIARYYTDKYTRSALIEGAFEAHDFFPQFGESGKWLFFTAAPLKDSEGEIVGAIETLQDGTEERRMQDNLRYYLQQISVAQEEERKRIARELHDETAQALYALNREVDNFLRSNPNTPADNAEFLRDLNKGIKQVLQEVRRFGQDLRPPMLDDLGLLATLRWLVSELKEQFGIAADVTVSGNERRFSEETELTIFRIVQEALRNVWRHSQATKAEVIVEFDEGRTRITVKDNGEGFVLPHSIGDIARDGKLGLAGMQERARLLGGELKIESQPGKGTSITVEAPI
jgi:two-component system sensor histidine kinase DegS